MTHTSLIELIVCLGFGLAAGWLGWRRGKQLREECEDDR